MKYSVLILMLIAFHAQAKPKQKCEKAAVTAAFKIYKDECGGFGKLTDCEIVKSTEKSGKIAINVTCGFSGEPDYSDYLDVDFVLDLGSCSVQKKKIKDCHTD